MTPPWAGLCCCGSHTNSSSQTTPEAHLGRVFHGLSWCSLIPFFPGTVSLPGCYLVLPILSRSLHTLAVPGVQLSLSNPFPIFCRHSKTGRFHFVKVPVLEPSILPGDWDGLSSQLPSKPQCQALPIVPSSLDLLPVRSHLVLLRSLAVTISHRSSSSPSHAHPHLSVLQLHFHRMEFPVQPSSELRESPTLRLPKIPLIRSSCSASGNISKTQSVEPIRASARSTTKRHKEFCGRESSFFLHSHFWELILSSHFSSFPSVYAAKNPIPPLLTLLCNLSGVGESRRESGGMRARMALGPEGRNIN